MKPPQEILDKIVSKARESDVKPLQSKEKLTLKIPCTAMYSLAVVLGFPFIQIRCNESSGHGTKHRAIIEVTDPKSTVTVEWDSDNG